jgi:hypothetical protein
MPGMLETLRRRVGAAGNDGGERHRHDHLDDKGMSSDIVPEDVPGEVLLQVRQGPAVVSLEPQAGGRLPDPDRRADQSAACPARNAWCCR